MAWFGHHREHRDCQLKKRQKRFNYMEYNEAFDDYKKRKSLSWKNAERKQYDVWEVETGELNPYEEIIAWGRLIKKGLVWKLQGWYGRRASEFINNGIISSLGVVNKDKAQKLIDSGWKGA